MKLEKYCRDRLVVLTGGDTAYDAARAMAANHVGAVLVTERGRLAGIVTDRDLALRAATARISPSGLELREVMTEDPMFIDAQESLEAAAEAMAEAGVRRLVVRRGGKPAGIVTLDDLIVAASLHPHRLREIVLAQLYQPAPSKPEGLVRPSQIRRHAHNGAARRASRRASTLSAFTHRVQELTGLASAKDALTAFDVVASALAARLQPAEARDFAAQLPSSIREGLLAQAPGPDKSVSRQSMQREMADRLGLNARRADELVTRLCEHMDALVSKGELEDVIGQLPRDLKLLFHHAA